MTSKIELALFNRCPSISPKVHKVPIKLGMFQQVGNFVTEVKPILKLNYSKNSKAWKGELRQTSQICSKINTNFRKYKLKPKSNHGDRFQYSNQKEEEWRLFPSNASYNSDSQSEDSTVDSDNSGSQATDVKDCSIVLARLSSSQFSDNSSLIHSSVNMKTPPSNKYGRWKGRHGISPKPTLCGALVSGETNPGMHERHDRKSILLKTVKLKKPVLSDDKDLRPLRKDLGGRIAKKILQGKGMPKVSVSGSSDALHNGKENLLSDNEDMHVRKSSRRVTLKDLKYLRQIEFKTKILSKCQEGLRVAKFRGKGRGLVTTRNFAKGDFVVEYIGELTNMQDALERERLYEDDESIGCFMYFFQYNSTRFCIDATKESPFVGRLVNHSRLRANLVPRIVAIMDVPHLALEAKENIPAGTELLFDYGDRSSEALANHPWLRL